MANPFQSDRNGDRTPGDEGSDGDRSFASQFAKADESAIYIRRFLRHREFRAEKQRLGKVILARQRNLSFWKIGDQELQRLDWPKP
jgi:hypothetical protein